MSKSKSFCLVIALLMMFGVATPSSFAVGAKEAGASLLLPTTGQAMNGELGTGKSKVMAGVEVAAIATIAVLGTLVGGGVVWAGLGPLIANHAWSATDAYKGAQDKTGAAYQQQVQLSQAQQTLDLSRQRRYEREQTLRSDIRSRMAEAAQLAY